MTSYLAYFSTKQEQRIAAQIVQVVIAGNSVKIPGGLLNGQVTVLFFSLLSELFVPITLLAIFCWSPKFKSQDA